MLTDDLRPWIEGRDAVFSCLGLPLSPSTLVDPPPLYTEGMLRIAGAMRGTGVTRIVTISATFTQKLDIGPLWFRGAVRAMRPVYRQMADMERILRAGDLDWTAVRPGWLLARPQTGDYRVEDGQIAAGTLRTRHGDLADFMLRCAAEDMWVCGTPAISREEPLPLLSPASLLEDLSFS